MRILLAESQPKVRFALRVLLERQPGIEIVGEIDDADKLVLQVEVTRPDLVLIHWSLGGTPNSGLVSTLRRSCPQVSVVALSGRPEARKAALQAGADAFVSKMDPPERLLAAINDCCPRPR